MLVCAGNLQCRWSPLPSSPHTGAIFQLLQQPQGSTQHKKLQTPVQQHQHQQQQEQGEDEGGSSSIQTGTLQVQQQEAVGLSGAYTVLSTSLDRSFALSQLVIEQAAVSAAPAASAADLPTNTSSSSGSSGTGNCVTLTLPGPSTPFTSSSNSSSSSSGADGGSWRRPVQLQVHVRGCSPVWVCQGLGGFAYSLAVQPAAATAAMPAAAAAAVRDGSVCEGTCREQKVRVAVGSGDKTIRVVTLTVRTADTLQDNKHTTIDQQQQRDQQEQQQLLQQEEAVAPTNAAGGAAAVVPSCSCEVAVPASKPVLLWRGIQDRPQALAWHPTNPRE